MGLTGNRALWVALLGVVLSALLLVFGAGYLALVVVSGLLSGGPVVGTLLDIAVPAIVGGALLVVLMVVSGVAFLRALLWSLSFPRNARVASVLARIEGIYPPFGRVGLSDRFAPPEPSPEERVERALEDLKARYVNGELTETEFERRVDRLVSDEPVGDLRIDREREPEREWEQDLERDRDRVVEAGSGRH